MSGGWIGGDVAGGRAGGSGRAKRSFQKPASEDAQPDEARVRPSGVPVYITIRRRHRPARRSRTRDR